MKQLDKRLIAKMAEKPNFSLIHFIGNDTTRNTVITLSIDFHLIIILLKTVKIN